MNQSVTCDVHNMHVFKIMNEGIIETLCVHVYYNSARHETSQTLKNRKWGFLNQLNELEKNSKNKNIKRSV